MIIESVQPYEMLTRWTNGVLADSSFRVLTTLADDQTGEVYAVTESDPMTLQMAIEAGWQAQVGQVLADAQVRLAQVQAQLAKASA